MANTLSNMKVTNPIKELVSKRRKRYTEEGFNLDLTYIRPNLIAMGFPAEKLEAVYRNHIDDVVKFLETKHKDHYYIYNLCSERSYDKSKFQQRVANYPFDDHNPPKIEVIRPFCNDVQDWLSKDSRNVAVVHCKAGKGRTGVMLCCYMLHSKQFKNPSDALNYYGQQRTTDTKGVTIPSQRRYVSYYATLIQENLDYKPVSVLITEIRLEPLPSQFNGTQGSVMFVISEGSKKVYSSGPVEVKRGQHYAVFNVDCPPVQGDIKIEFFNKQKRLRKEKMFHFWFNTFFVREEQDVNIRAGENGNSEMIRLHSCEDKTTDTASMQQQQHHLNHQPRASSLGNIKADQKMHVLRINKGELDDAHKDKTHKHYPPDFRVVVYMVKGLVADVSRDKTDSVRTRTKSEVTDSSSATDEEEDDDSAWDSVEGDEKVVRYHRLSESELCIQASSPTSDKTPNSNLS